MPAKAAASILFCPVFYAAGTFYVHHIQNERRQIKVDGVAGQSDSLDVMAYFFEIRAADGQVLDFVKDHPGACNDATDPAFGKAVMAF
jgi:hypothetical protein